MSTKKRIPDLSLIEDYFISFSNETQSLITNLKLQKMLYYAQSWHLAIKGFEIFKEDFQAWIHGPVIPEIYNKYKENYWNPIQRGDLKEGSYQEILGSIHHEMAEVLEDVKNEYFGLSAFELEQLTHNEEPWIKARNGIPADTPSKNLIEKDWMKQYYAKFLKSGKTQK